jgi:hypothetical protein
MLQEATIQEKAAARSTLLLRTGMQQLLLNPRRVVAAFLEASCAKGWEPRSFLYAYQFWPSPPISLAINAATLSSRLPFNMSVTSLRDTKTSGSGKPRYGLPDAPLDSCSLVSASPSPTKTGIPFPFSLLLRLSVLGSADSFLKMSARRNPAWERRGGCIWLACVLG